MDSSRKYHLDSANQDPERLAWYVLTYKWTLAIKYRITMLQPTEHTHTQEKELSNKDVPTENARISLRRVKVVHAFNSSTQKAKADRSL